MAGIRFRCSDAQFAQLRQYRQGESDLVCRDGKWFLYATCEVPEPDLTDPGGFLGVDLGIANIAGAASRPMRGNLPARPEPSPGPKR